MRDTYRTRMNGHQQQQSLQNSWNHVFIFRFCGLHVFTVFFFRSTLSTHMDSSYTISGSVPSSINVQVIVNFIFPWKTSETLNECSSQKEMSNCWDANPFFSLILRRASITFNQRNVEVVVFFLLYLCLLCRSNVHWFRCASIRRKQHIITVKDDLSTLVCLVLSQPSTDDKRWLFDLYYYCNSETKNYHFVNEKEMPSRFRCDEWESGQRSSYFLAHMWAAARHAQHFGE